MFFILTDESSDKVSDLAPLACERVSPLVVHYKPEMVSNGLLVPYLVELCKRFSHDSDEHVQQMDQKEEGCHDKEDPEKKMV
jgi:hypothetical protein